MNHEIIYNNNGELTISGLISKKAASELTPLSNAIMGISLGRPTTAFSRKQTNYDSLIIECLLEDESIATAVLKLDKVKLMNSKVIGTRLIEDKVFLLTEDVYAICGDFKKVTIGTIGEVTSRLNEEDKSKAKAETSKKITFEVGREYVMNRKSLLYIGSAYGSAVVSGRSYAQSKAHIFYDIADNELYSFRTSDLKAYSIIETDKCNVTKAEEIKSLFINFGTESMEFLTEGKVDKHGWVYTNNPMILVNFARFPASKSKIDIHFEHEIGTFGFNHTSFFSRDFKNAMHNLKRFEDKRTPEQKQKDIFG